MDVVLYVILVFCFGCFLVVQGEKIYRVAKTFREGARNAKKPPSA